jgi:hypothetical protein
MAIEGSRIQTGLAAMPEDNVPPELYDNFFSIHRAIQNLVRGVSDFCGVDAPPQEIWDQILFSQTLLSSNLTRIYLPASAAILRGQTVNLHDNAGVLNARLAVATSAATMAHGIANTAAAPGEIVEVNWLRGLLDSVGGMTVGTLYWLSTTPGAIQNVAPGGAGQIQQPIGVAFSAQQLSMDIPLSYRQL